MEEKKREAIIKGKEMQKRKIMRYKRQETKCEKIQNFWVIGKEKRNEIRVSEKEKETVKKGMGKTKLKEGNKAITNTTREKSHHETET